MGKQSCLISDFEISILTAVMIIRRRMQAANILDSVNINDSVGISYVMHMSMRVLSILMLLIHKHVTIKYKWESNIILNLKFSRYSRRR